MFVKLILKSWYFLVSSVSVTSEIGKTSTTGRDSDTTTLEEKEKVSANLVSEQLFNVNLMNDYFNRIS